VPHDVFQERIHKDVVDLMVEDPVEAQSIKDTISQEHQTGAINNSITE